MHYKINVVPLQKQLKRNIMKKIKFFVVAMAALMTFGMTSCKDDGVINESVTLTKDKPIIISSKGTDTTATYPIKVKISLEGSEIVVLGQPSSPDASTESILHNRDCGNYATVADFGEVKKLKKINAIPDAKKFGEKVVATEKHGYVIKGEGKANLNAYSNQYPQLKDPQPLYIRLFVSKAAGDGFEVEYDYPFTVD